MANKSVIERRWKLSIGAVCFWCSFWVQFAAAATNEITEPFEGVRLIHTNTTAPRLLDMYVAEIDPSAAGIGFLVSPSNGSLAGEVTPQTTREFVTQVGARLGVNAEFFASATDGQFNVLGLAASNGDVYSEFQSGFVNALNITRAKVASIIQATGTTGTAHLPDVSLYNAVTGNTRLVANGLNVANSDPAIHPRTAAGVTADGKVLLITVDGRNPTHSNGVTYSELADILVRWGARDAINLDGGGSTTFVMDNPLTAIKDPQVTNIPSDPLPDSPHGQERTVGNSLAVFASPPSGPTENEFVYADFEQGDASTFDAPLSFSGSNRGFNRELSTAEVLNEGGHDGTWAQRLTIVNDPTADGDVNNPGGAWFVRHVSGVGAPSNNVSRPALGSVGFWARTSTPDLQISLVVDDASLATGERGVLKSMTADGQWHPYFWQVDDASQWDGWVNGDGVVNTSFTLDSIQIFGPPNGSANLDATIDIDAVTHIMPGYLPGDFNGDFVVDAADYVVWRQGLGTTYTQGDYDIWRSHYGQTASSGAGIGISSVVPEPASIAIVLLLSLILPELRRRPALRNLRDR